MDKAEVERLAKIIWDYHHLNHKLKKADVIVVLGSHDIQVADRGAELFWQGFAPLIVMSGGLGELTRKIWKKPEAVFFAERAKKLGVPAEKIIMEDKSSNTGENVEFTRELLGKNGITARTIIAVCKPDMERRTFATFRRLWPEVYVLVASPQISFEKYKSENVSRKELISIMVGDLQRIKEYPKKGFQIPQRIPKKVWRAFQELVAAGYAEHLLKE
ncbi:YdcF family protein [Candidatus Shapirobacteria bacterium]|nr:YdcF family protein [Candidatus Shapirobacteria bacterium]